MKVCLVSPYSLTLPGGVQGQVLGLARALRALGASTVVLGPCDGEPPEPGVIPLGRSVPFATNGSVAPIAPDPPAAARALAAVRAERPDVLHLHEPISPGAMWSALLGTRIPAVGTFHASGQAPSAFYRSFRPIARAVGRRLAIRTAVSDDARRIAEAHLGGAYRVLPNAVDVERYEKAPDSLAPGDRPPILFVGRHEERKGLEVLLDACSRLERDAVLWVAGHGPRTGELRDRWPSTGGREVVWLGPVPEREKARRMRSAAVFCAPSLHGESFGIVLLEAMAAGTPVVASDIPGYRDVARRDREALLVPPRDPAALGAALDALLGDPGLHARLVESGRERAAQYSMTALAERYLRLYEQAVTIERAKPGGPLRHRIGRRRT